NAQYNQAKPAQTLLNMRLADALVSAKGWPDTGVVASIYIPYLQRFQTQLAGALTANLQWRGAWPAGQGQASVVLKQLVQRNGTKSATPLLKQARLTLAGRLEKHRLTLDVAANQGAVALKAEGGLALKSKSWAGQLTQATVTPSQSRWQLKSAATLSVSLSESHLEQACWQQTDAALSPWQVCTQVDLNPQQWLATLTAQAPTGGSLKANVRRDPRVSEPLLDADLSWQAINLATLPIALPEGLAFSGRSAGDIRVAGTLAQPALTGQWSVDASVDWPRYGLQWPQFIIDGRLSGQRSTWTAVLKDSSNGQLTMTGQAGWQPDVSVSAQITGDQLAFTYAPWVQGKISPKVDVAWKNQQLSVKGDVLVNRADITLKSLAAGAPKPSSDVVVVRNREGRRIALNDAPNGLPLSLHLRIILGDAISLTGYGLDAGLRGQLLLTQSPRTPMAATGEISLKPNAQFAAYGQRLNIEQGRLLFAGPLTTPDIRLSASREIDGVKVGVKVTGQAPKPVMALTSDSPMSQDEILSYLLLGRALGNSQEASAADKQALALSAALNLTGKTGAVGLLGQRLGISDFAIGTQGNSASTEVAVSGRLSPKLWLSVGRGVFQPSQSVTVRYQINRRLSLEALSALESAITLFYSWRF
ncbi:MAG: translocation/assembly module TamB domain-containing protein, partial [Paraperlucidibaca sp.]